MAPEVTQCQPIFLILVLQNTVYAAQVQWCTHEVNRLQMLYQLLIDRPWHSYYLQAYSSHISDGEYLPAKCVPRSFNSQLLIRICN